MNKTKQEKPRAWVKMILISIIILLGAFLFIPKGYFGSGISPRAHRVATIASLKGLETEILNYEKDNHQLPKTLEDLTKLTSTNSPYVKPSDLVDAWGNNYQYSRDQFHKHGFTISTTSPEGESFNNDE